MMLQSELACLFRLIRLIAYPEWQKGIGVEFGMFSKAVV